MKIDVIALPLIKSPAFCTLDDAINYAKEFNRSSAWALVVSRPDMTASLALKYARELNKPNLWRHVLVHPDLKPEEAIGLAIELGGVEVWKQVLGREDVPFRRALPITIGMKESGFYDDVLEVIFAKSDIIPSSAIPIATELDNYCVLSVVLGNETVVEYLKSLPIAELFTLATITNNNIAVFKIIISREDTSIDELYNCLTLTGDNAIFEKVVARADFQKSLNELTIQALIEKAKKIDWYLYWDIVLEREEVKTDTELAMSLIKLENYHLTDNLLKLPVVLDYIASLSVEKAIELLSLGSTSLREKIIVRGDVMAYLKACKKSDAASIALSCPHHYVRNLIFQRSDFSTAEAVEYSRDPYDYSQLIKTQSFVSYFRKLPITDAVILAKKINMNDVYELLMRRRSLSFNEMMEIAKEVNTTGVWNIVLARNDVKKYYGLK